MDIIDRVRRFVEHIIPGDDPSVEDQGSPDLRNESSPAETTRFTGHDDGFVRAGGGSQQLKDIAKCIGAALSLVPSIALQADMQHAIHSGQETYFSRLTSRAAGALAMTAVIPLFTAGYIAHEFIN